MVIGVRRTAENILDKSYIKEYTSLIERTYALPAGHPEPLTPLRERVSGNPRKLSRVLHARACEKLISPPNKTKLDSHVEARRRTHGTLRKVHGRRDDGESSRNESDDRGDEHGGNDRVTC